MFEVRVTVEAPDVCAAVRELAAAMVATAGAPRAVNTAEKQTPTQPAQPTQQFTQPALRQPVQQAPAARQDTADEIARAGASLREKGLMPQLIALLGKYNVQSITGLRPDQFPAFAEDLKAMGADL